MNPGDTGGDERLGWRAWRHLAGGPLLILGIVGLFLQGILFIVIALTVLAPEVGA